MGQSPAPLQNGIVVVVVVVIVVVVVGAGQLGPLPGVGHASQQLTQLPTVPPLAVHAAGSLAILHVARQHVTLPGELPQVDLAAHLFTTPLQLLGRLGLVPLDNRLAMPATHLTYVP